VNLMRLLAVARKEFLHVLRDPTSLGLALAIPAMLLVLFGYALRMDVENVPLAVLDHSRTRRSRDFLALYESSRYFSLTRRARTYREVEDALDTGEAVLALVVPADFESRIARGRDCEVQAIVDGSEPNIAGLALAYAQATAATESVRLAERALARRGVRVPSPPLELATRVWFNPDLESKDFIVPGLVALVMMVVGALLTSLTVAREWERGTMEQLISTPVSARELIAGKLIPYFVVGSLDVVIAVAMGSLVFGVPIRGSVFLVFAYTSVFLVGALALGFVVSVVTRSQLLANQLAFITTLLPTFLLSGFAFPISNMPGPVRLATYLVPARYLVFAMRAIYAKGLGLGALALELVLLSAFAIAMLTLAMGRFVKRLS